MTDKKKVVKSAVKSAKKQPSGRPFPKGESGNTSGRPKGSKSFKTLAFEERLAALNCDPLKVLTTICDDVNEETSLRLQAAKELTAYIFPKRKAVELSTGQGDEALSFTVNLVSPNE